ncbi:MAG: hypothetical protein LUQ55_02745, partial [Methanomassiliicoccales archaeon]|nr:hypothetical protein [Methanomassiliicoccales archaeon]
EIEEESCDRTLLCPEEWCDPAGRKVLCEFHKEGLPDGAANIEADLESFERLWKAKGSTSVHGEYHKKGAPFLERGTGSSLAGQRTIEASKLAEEDVKEAREGRGEPGGTSEGIGRMKEGGISESEHATPKEEPPGLHRPINMSTLEVISYALFRFAFGKGVRIPIKREGMIDMDITVKGKEIVVNSSQIFFTFPELTVWHVVYTHKGKRILEFGRGVKGMKIHRFRAFLLALEIWRGSRKGPTMNIDSSNKSGDREKIGA